MPYINYKYADEVFTVICNRDTALDDYTKLVSVPYIAETLGITKYRVRKAIDHLKFLGYIASDCESCYDVYQDRYVIVRGYVVTKSGRNTEIYRKAAAEEEKIRNEFFCASFYD